MPFWDHTASGLAVPGRLSLFRVYGLPQTVVELAMVADSFHTKPLMRIVQSADRYQILGQSRNAFSMYEGNRDALYRLDQAVLNHFSQPSGRRLILAALCQHHHPFRAVSHNTYLMDEAIDSNPDAMSIDALREQAWLLVLPHYLKRLAGFDEALGAARSIGRGADELGSIATSAVAGRIKTLLIEADRLVPGRIDAASGVIAIGDPSDPEFDDVLDDLGEHVLRSGSDVIIVPTERMPARTGAAAIYRF